MAARVSSRRRWFLRDVPRTYVLLVWLAFGLVAFLYAVDWHPSGWSALRQEAAVKPQHRDLEYNTGSIIIVPIGGETRSSTSGSMESTMTILVPLRTAKLAVSPL